MKPNHNAISRRASYRSRVPRMGDCSAATLRGDLTYQHLPFYPIEKHVAVGAFTLFSIYNMYMAHTTSSTGSTGSIVSIVSISSTLDPRVCVHRAAGCCEGPRRVPRRRRAHGLHAAAYTAHKRDAHGVWDIAGWVRERHESVSARVFYLLESRLVY